MSYNFHVGQQVVCINDNHGEFPGKRIKYAKNLHGLKKDGIYTIRGFCFYDGDSCVYLDEIIRPICWDEKIECGFFIGRFCPLIKTDISLFQAMLVPTDKRIDA